MERFTNRINSLIVANSTLGPNGEVVTSAIFQPFRGDSAPKPAPKHVAPPRFIRERPRPARVNDSLNINDHIGSLCANLHEDLKHEEEFFRVVERIGRDPVVMTGKLEPGTLRRKIWTVLHGTRPMPEYVAEQFI